MMTTWYVSYKFKSGGEWVQSNMYVEAASPLQAESLAQMILDNSGYKYVILRVRMVGEGR